MRLLRRPSTWVAIVGTVFGFLVGMAPRRPISDGVDWCRDVDYGSLPQWLALIVGAVVAGFTIFGILTARKSYVEDVRHREFAQARLVYSELLESRVADTAGSTTVLPLTDPTPTIIQFREEDVLPAEIEPRVGGRSQGFTANMPVRIYKIMVHNDSDELISMVVTRMESNSVTIDSLSRGGRIVGPHSTLETFFIIPKDDGGDEPKIGVRFTDSTGVRWSRTGGDPVVKTDQI